MIVGILYLQYIIIKSRKSQFVSAIKLFHNHKTSLHAYSSILNRTCMCYQVKLSTKHVICMSPVSFRSNMILTNLWPLSINYMLPYSFYWPSEHAKRCREFSDNNLSCVPRIKCLNYQKMQPG